MLKVCHNTLRAKRQTCYDFGYIGCHFELAKWSQKAQNGQKPKRVHFGPFLLEIQGSNFVTSHYRPRADHALIIVNLAIITIGQKGPKWPKIKIKYI